jgi:hypothetical protein
VVEMIKSSLADVLEDEHGQIGMRSCVRFCQPVLSRRGILLHLLFVVYFLFKIRLRTIKFV